MSGRLAITPGFEAPPVQPASAAGSILQTTAAQTAAAIKDASQTKVSSAFANLIQELAQEAAPKLPSAAATPKTAPRAVQQSVVSPGQPAPKLPAVQPDRLAPAAMELPPLVPNDGRTATAAKVTPVPQSTAESTPDVSQPTAASPAPSPASPSAPSEGPRRQPKSEASRPQENPAPIAIDAALFIPITPPISLKLPSFITHPSEAMGGDMGGSDLRTTSTSRSTSTGAPEQTLDLRPAPALELKLRAQDQPTPEQPATPAAASAPIAASKPATTDQQADSPSQPTVTSGTQTRAEQIVHAFASAPGPAAIVPTPAQSTPTSTTAIPPAPVTPPQAINTNAGSTQAPPAQPPAAHLADEPVSRQPEQHAQPLRSLSLEFAPDGAQDVRVRLEERAGDVHISLHSTDPALSGRLSDGVHELVGTLANAGYDAQAWTHGQGRQNHSEQHQAPPDDPRRNRRGNSADPGAEDFDAILQQPTRTKP